MIIDLDKLNASIKDSQITVEKHPTEDLYLYGYYSHPTLAKKNVWNDYSTMCRGLILDGKGNVIERAFDKFWTFRSHLSNDIIRLSENRVIKLPTAIPKIYEKVDGTMGILYWVNDMPYIATQRSFVGAKAEKGTALMHGKYLEALKKLNRRYSYIFEIVYPQNSIIINYGDMEDLILIGVINKETGESIDDFQQLGFPVKTDMTRQFDGWKSLNELAEANLPNMEGLVLEYDKSLRIKVKFPWYKETHAELQKIINAEFQKTESLKKLRAYFNVQPYPLSSAEVIKHWEKGPLGMIELKSKLSMEQIDRGAFQWIDRHIAAYKNQQHKMEYFSDSAEYNYVPDSRLWNWKERYLTYSYD